MNLKTLNLTDEQVELILFALSKLTSNENLAFARDYDLSAREFAELKVDLLVELVSGSDVDVIKDE